MSLTRPATPRMYQNHTLDSTRWDHYSPRDDDIVIATPYKSGTTWMQIIVMHLIFGDLQSRPVWEHSPWFELRWGDSLDALLKKVEAQQHRRFFKTHLPLDGLPYFEQTKYIVVGRDPRDVFMSLWNFYANFRDERYEQINSEWHGKPFPRCPEDIHDFWPGWIGQGWFEWEHEGYPFWSNMRHVQTWWNFKHLPNILFVHFNDLLSELEGEIQRIAEFLDIPLTSGFCTQVAEAVTFKRVKENAEQLGTPQDFFYKGTNGRWHNVLSDAELELYHATVARELSPDCAEWLENGRTSKIW
jgi:aryl sulfotransferase